MREDQFHFLNACISMQVRTCEELLRSYFVQLAEGCCRIACDEPECASCRRFSHEFSDPNEVALCALNLTRNHPVKSHLCPGVDPLKVFPELKCKVDAFDAVARDLIRGQKPKSAAVLRETWSDIRVFSGILNFDQVPLTNGNIGLTDEMVGDMIAAAARFPTLFFLAKSDFGNLVSNVVNVSCNDSLCHVRSVLLLFAFGVYFVRETLDTFLMPLLKHIFQLPKDAHVLLEQNILPGLPSLIVHMNSVIHQGIAFWLRRQPDYQDPFGYHAAFVVNMLSNAWDHSSKKNRSNVTFTSDSFAEILDPVLETTWYLEKQVSILKVPAILPLNFRLQAYQSCLPELSDDQRVVVDIRRDHLVEDAMVKIPGLDVSRMRLGLDIRFVGEKGVDEGGVKREFFHLLINQVFSPNYGMFELLCNKFFWFKPLSTESMLAFKAIGILVSLAIYNSIILPIRFPLLLYKKLLMKPISMDDIAEIHPEVVASMKQIQEMGRKRECISDLCLQFSVTVDNYGHMEEIDLVQDGHSIAVDNDNYQIYIDTYVEWLAHTSIFKQFNAFQDGFYQLCNKDMLTIFSPEQVDVLVSGEEVYDWDALKERCIYTHYAPSAAQIKWFWQVFEKEMSQENKKKWLRFVTGSDKAPCGGLGELQIVIERSADTDLWPISHSCFNIFVLPAYQTKDKLKECVLGAIQYDEGFGIA